MMRVCASRRCREPALPKLVCCAKCLLACTQVTVVAGPPGAGKSRYVKERAQPGDLILDWDALYVALSGLPEHSRPDEGQGAGVTWYATHLFEAAIEKLTTNPEHLNAVWVITSSLERRQDLPSRLGARLVVLGSDPQECKQRLRDRGGSEAMFEKAAACVDAWSAA